MYTRYGEKKKISLVTIDLRLLRIKNYIIVWWIIEWVTRINEWVTRINEWVTRINEWVTRINEWVTRINEWVNEDKWMSYEDKWKSYEDKWVSYEYKWKKDELIKEYEDKQTIGGWKDEWMNERMSLRMQDNECNKNLQILRFPVRFMGWRHSASMHTTHKNTLLLHPTPIIDYPWKRSAYTNNFSVTLNYKC